MVAPTAAAMVWRSGGSARACRAGEHARILRVAGPRIVPAR
jgi:hypothetical protein